MNLTKHYALFFRELHTFSKNLVIFGDYFAQMQQMHFFRRRRRAIHFQTVSEIELSGS
jgi:hypothetical protein